MSKTQEWILRIEGMTCDGCARHVDEALSALPGVTSTETRYATGETRLVAGPDLSEDAVREAVAGAGYEVVDIRQATEGKAHRRGGGGEGYDLLVLGSGSAGFAAAIRAQDFGAKVAIVERGALGGTCVNVGCVPSKTLIRAAEAQHRATAVPFDGLDIHVGPPDFGRIIEQKRALVAELQKAKYWDVLEAYPNVDLIEGTARFRADGTVEVDGRPVPARKVLVATGASPALPPIPGIEEAEVLTSTELMELTALPKRLVVVGGGAIGVELGQAFARFGSEVTIVEALPHLVPHEDEAMGEALAGYLREEGLAILTGCRVEEIAGTHGAMRLRITREGAAETLEADEIVVATGRRPNTRGLRLEEAGIEVGARGEIVVDAHLETTRPGVFAAGDVTGEPAFVYVAAYAGALAAANALGEVPERYDVSVVPRVTFTDPAVASVGLTEEEARRRGLPVMVTELPMAYVPRAIAARDTRGLVKLVADRETRHLLGAHILAPEAGDILQEAVLAIRYRIPVDEIARMLHPYLTQAEALKLACQTFEKDVAKLSCCAA